jgi:hypothetical protein
MIFRISVAAELVLFALAKRTQTSSPSRYCRFAPSGFPKMPKAPLAKTSIRSHLASCIFEKAIKVKLDFAEGFGSVH